MTNVKTDNGLSLGQHSFVLVFSILFSVALHFGAVYYCKDMGVRHITHAEKRAHITPETLPPVNIATFLQKTEFLQAEAMQVPDATAEAETAAEALPEKVRDVSVPLPTMPSIPQVEPMAAANQFVPPPMPNVPLADAMARQEVVTIPETDFTSQTNPDPKWIVDAAVMRVPDAPDLASSVEIDESTTLGAMGGLPALPPMQETFSLESIPEVLAAETVAMPAETIETITAVPESSTDAVNSLANAAISAAKMGEISSFPQFEAIDNRLSLALTSYETPADPDNTYFRLAIVRRPESTLPIMSKDVIFIQDISGSIGTRRLERSKEAMKAALFRTLRVGDRFNIFAFRDVTLTPSGTWMTFDPNTRQRAEVFVNSLRAKGNTDLFLLLQDLLSLKRDPNRPLVAVVVTDGEATVGVTETTRIIGEFTRMNGGAISVYTFGIKQVNPYFLDMLCYANRGENTSASGNVKAIESELVPVFESIRNPVMKDLSIFFTAQSGGEIHPKKLTNLYADRALTVYGRVPRNQKTLTCQLRGNSSGAPYDAVFTFTLENATKSPLNLRKAWAERAMFDLLAEYAENPSAHLLNKIAQFSTQYGVRNPYAPDAK
jgi:Mg-chelatase subunit ChlD